VADMIARQYNFLRRQSRQQALSLVNELAVAAHTHILGNDFDGLQRVIKNFKNFPDLQYAMILAPDNEVLSHTDVSYIGKKALDSVSLRIGRQPGSQILVADDQIIDAVAPIMQAGSTIAWARVAISQEYIYSNLTAILRNGVFYILVAIAIGTLVAVLMGNRLTRGLHKLIAAAKKIRAGDRGLRAGASGSFEADHLAVAFNQMLDDIDANESLLKNAFDFSALGMTIADLDGRWTKVNGTLCRMLGYTEDELARTSFKEVTHPDDLKKNLADFALLQQGKIDKFSMDKRYIHKSGRLVWAHLTVSAAKDQQGRPVFFVAQVEDITEAVESSRELEKLHRVNFFISHINEMIVRAADEETILREACRIAIEYGKFRFAWAGLHDARSGRVLPIVWAGHEAEYLKGRGFSSLDVQDGRGPCGHAIRSRMAVYSNDIANDPLMAHARADALARGYRASIIFPLFAGPDVVSVFAMYMDEPHFFTDTEIKLLKGVTDNISFALDRHHESNRINKAVIDAQERERIQLGMELHDNVQQILAGAMMTLDYVFASYEDRTEALNALGDIKRYLGESMVELRRISHQLSPSIRFEQNLEDKIRALVETMNVGRTADVRLEIDPFREPLSQEIQLAFYRILQEQLSNILRYAHASRISIRLKELEKKITLSITDNGQGFDPATKKTGIGLENIRRRVAALEGEFKIVSSVGNGCELLLQVPAG
ncbi:MAG TPA: PAS domain S-box protein, partial [Puia sp.]